MRLLTSLAAVTAVASLYACKHRQAPKAATVKADAAHATILEGHIEGGVLRTKRSRDQRAYVDLIRKHQLKYAIGHLQDYDAGIDLERGTIKIIGETLVKNGLFSDVVDVSYDAFFTITWPQEFQDQIAYPDAVNVLVPAAFGVSNAGTESEMRAKFEKACVREEDEAGQATLARFASYIVDSNSFFFEYSPSIGGCPLASAAQKVEFNSAVETIDGVKLHRLPIFLHTSALASDGKKPNYTKIWDDNRLNITIVVGKDDEGVNTADDEGIKKYNAIYVRLLNTMAPYGAPKLSVALAPGVEPAPAIVDMDLSWQLAATAEKQARSVSVKMLLVDSVYQNIAVETAYKYRTRAAHFREVFTKRSADSDLIIFNGHSRLGRNVADLARLTQVKSGRYYILMVDSCVSFAYFNQTLRQKLKAANSGVSAGLLNTITNAMTTDAPTTNIAALLEAIIGEDKTYREILADFDPSQRAIVEGEEDNP